jgi:hypothetical protein
MCGRPGVMLVLVALAGCVNLSRPASLASVQEPDADGMLPDPPAVDGAPTDDAPAPDAPGAEGPPSPDASVADGAAADSADPADSASPVDAGPPDGAPADAAGSCSSHAHCQDGLSCIAQTCAPLPALVLHWTLDETSGSVAEDASGNGLQGTYGGESGMPATSTAAPTLQFADPGSRSFVAASRHEVRIGSLPAVLRRTSDVTLSAWFRTGAITHSSGYGSLASVGDGYSLYVGRERVGFIKRTANRDYHDCSIAMTGHLDDRWHHLLGYVGSTGMKFFIDGVERCTNPNTEAIAYSSSPAPVVLVGRDPDANYGWYYDGEIDDVRVYSRVLTSAEIARLAAGAR